MCGTHQQLHHRPGWLWRTYPMAATDAACHKAPLHSVDASLEIFGTLLQGRPLVVVPEEAATNPDVLLPLLAETGVTRLFLVVSHLRLLLLVQPRLGDVLPALSLCAVSGERLLRRLVHAFQSAAFCAKLVNLRCRIPIPLIAVARVHPPSAATVRPRISTGAPIPPIPQPIATDFA